MLEKLAGVEARYDELERLMSDPATMNDPSKLTEYAKERSGLEDVVAVYREYKKAEADLTGSREMVDAETVAETAALLIALPNNASVATLALNCQPEAAW